MSLQRNPTNNRVGSGAVSGQQSIAVGSGGTDGGSAERRNDVKSPSASAHGFASFPSPRTHSGAGGSAPSFSESDAFVLRMEIEAAGRERDVMLDYERLQEERIAAVRESSGCALRMEAERKNEARQRAAKLETDVACLQVEVSVWRFIAVMPWIIFPAMWVVLR